MKSHTDSLNQVAQGRVTLILICTLFMLLTSVVPAVGALVREPYLQLTTPTSVTIVWRTDLTSANNSQVEYGTNATNLDQTAPGSAGIPLSNSNVKDHVVTIAGLSPATTYFYNVGTVTDGVQGGGTTEHYFVTAPSVGTAAPFTVWVVGDGGDGSAGQQNVRDAMLAETGATPPNLFLPAGDNAYEDGTDGEFTSNHFSIYQDILRHTPSWPTLGNHEARSVNTALGTGPYYEAHVLPTGGEAGGVPSGMEAYYSFDYANAHFIVLDSMDSSRSPGSPMLTWLQADLSGTAQEWVIALFHHPPYTKGTHDSDSAVDSGGRLVDMREDVLPILEAGGVDLVLGGHSHIYERSYPLLGAYGYGVSPNFATPDFGTLLSSGNILDTGDGDPSGDGAYQDGTVYVVAGHGGKPTGGTGGHPVMFFFDLALGSVLLDVNGSTLTGRNLRSTGAITDLFAIDHSVGGGGDPAITSPTPGSTLTASPTTFQWSAGSGVDEYWLYVGTTPGGKDIYNQSQGTGTSVSVSGIPLNGNPAYVRLYWRIGGTWSSTDYTYQTQGGGGGGDPAITSPTPGSTLTASPTTFQWSAGSGVDEYWLYVGTTPGGKDIYNQSQGTGTSVSVSGIPLNGNPAYVRLYWRIGGTWSSTDYTYQTQGGGGGGDPAITSPTPGSTLTASPTTFQWSAGSGVDEYWLYVGTTPGGKDIYNQSQGTGTSVSVSGIPLNGNPAYVRLYWRIGGTWSSTDYTYQTQGGGGGGDPAITSPTPGSTLTASPTTFQWSAGSGVDEYWLYVGTTPGGKDIYNQSQGTGTSVSVSGIPLNGNPAYVRLYWRIGGTWSSTDYTYQTQGGGGGGDPAITSPTPGSTLTASPTTFQWSAGSGVDEYWLYVGTTPGGKDIYNQSQGTGTSVSVSGIPLNGNPAYVRLYWRIGGTWSSTDYTYQTQGGGGR